MHHKPARPEGSGAESAAALAKIKTNPNWIDIRYDPQHHRFARNETPAVSSAGQRLNPIAVAAARPGLWSGAKVRQGGLVAYGHKCRLQAACAGDSYQEKEDMNPISCVCEEAPLARCLVSTWNVTLSFPPPLPSALLNWFVRFMRPGEGQGLPDGEGGGSSGVHASSSIEVVFSEQPQQPPISRVISTTFILGNGSGGTTITGTSARRRSPQVFLPPPKQEQRQRGRHSRCLLALVWHHQRQRKCCSDITT